VAEALRVVRRPLPAAAAVLVAILLTLLTWQVASLLARAGVDPSWRVALHLAHLRGIRFGPDFVWTYGPLGFLAFPVAVSGGTLAAAVAFVFATQAALAYVLVRRAGATFGWLLGVGAAYLVLALPILQADFLPLIALGLALWALAEPAGAAARLLPLVGGVLAAAAALTKTNMGVAAIGVVLVAAAAGGLRRLGATVAVVVAAFAVLWVAFGNSLADVPEWLRLSASLVSGYSAAMQLERPGQSDDYLLAAVVAALLLAAAGVAARNRPRRHAAATILVVAGFAFAAFKESFVRHDPVHVPAFFAAAAIALLCLGVRGRAAVLVVAGVVAAVVAIGRAGRLDVDPLASAGHALAHLRDAADAGRRAELVARSRSDQHRSYQVPAAALALLRGHTVHVDPWDAAAVSAYRLRWRPLPVLQSYSAYTSTLDERNAAFLASGAAPERILRQNTPDQVNGRDHSLEAPATYRGILCNYRQLRADAHWQVLARHPRCGKPRLLGVLTVPSGQPVAIPEGRPDELVVARVGLHESLWNRIRGLAYKPDVGFVALGGGPYTPVAAAVVGDGIVVHVPGNAGFDPRYGGAIDWRTIAAGGASGGVTLTFDAIPVRGTAPPPGGEPPPAVLPHDLLESSAGREHIVLADGRDLPVKERGGFVDYAYVRRGSLVLQGWAADEAAGVPAETILVFADGRLVFAGPPNVPRQDVADALGKPGLRRAGYVVRVPLAAVRDGDARRDVRIFSIVGDRALEVVYPLSYGWRRR
jgi:hypothetical protein